MKELKRIINIKNELKNEASFSKYTLYAMLGVTVDESCDNIQFDGRIYYINPDHTEDMTDAEVKTLMEQHLQYFINGTPFYKLTVIKAEEMDNTIAFYADKWPTIEQVIRNKVDMKPWFDFKILYEDETGIIGSNVRMGSGTGGYNNNLKAAIGQYEDTYFYAKTKTGIQRITENNKIAKALKVNASEVNLKHHMDSLGNKVLEELELLITTAKVMGYEVEEKVHGYVERYSKEYKFAKDNQKLELNFYFDNDGPNVFWLDKNKEYGEDKVRENSFEYSYGEKRKQIQPIHVVINKLTHYLS